MKLRGPQYEDVNFEMTSMIDVVFLLIAFFMTVTSFASAERVNVEMPVAPAAKVPEDSLGRQFISIDADGRFYIGAKESTIEEVRETMAEKFGAEDFKGIYLRADANTHYRYVSKIMKTAAEIGITNIIFGVEQQKTSK